MSKQGELRVGSGSKYLLNGGICYDDETTLNISQSPFGGLLNMCLDDGGMPVKRQGQAYIGTSLGNGKINGMCDFKGNIIFAFNGKLYKQTLNSAATEIYSEISDEDIFMLNFNGILYIFDGIKYLQYDGSIVKEVDPYKPRVSMNRKPDGSQSEVDESWNVIGRGFKNTFNGDGTSKVYKLSFNGLDPDKVVCNVGGVEGSGFAVNRVNGTITFTNAPPEGNNNVEITAYKSFPGKKETILKCKYGTEFSNRVFLSGNDDMPNFYFCSGITDSNDITYFPEKYRYGIGSKDKKVTGFKVQYNKLVVFKEDCTCTVESNIGLDNLASFPISFLNTEIGCDMPGSIQLVNNNILFANTQNGIHCIVSTTIPGEKNIICISQNINGNYERPGLTNEDISLLRGATSIDFKSKYYLCVGSKCYILDYKEVFSTTDTKKNRWFIYDNINANCFGIYNNKLIYGHREKGVLCSFTNSFSDFGEPINSIWKSKLLDFGYPDYLKLISDIWYTCRAKSNSDVNIKYFNDENILVDEILIDKRSMSNFSWKKFGWANFSWIINLNSPTFRKKIRLRNIRYFQIEFSNNNVDETLSIIGLTIKYSLTKQVR